MQIIRWILGRFILFFDWVLTPKSIKRSAEQQAELDKKMASFALYQYPACPFCVKVRRSMKRNNLKIKTVNANSCEVSKKELETGGGKLKVPCLRIENNQGEVNWMYESSDIISYLENEVSESRAA